MPERETKATLPERLTKPNQFTKAALPEQLTQHFLSDLFGPFLSDLSIIS